MIKLIILVIVFGFCQSSPIGITLDFDIADKSHKSISKAPNTHHIKHIKPQHSYHDYIDKYENNYIQANSYNEVVNYDIKEFLNKLRLLKQAQPKVAKMHKNIYRHAITIISNSGAKDTETPKERAQTNLPNVYKPTPLEKQ